MVTGEKPPQFDALGIFQAVFIAVPLVIAEQGGIYGFLRFRLVNQNRVALCKEEQYSMPALLFSGFLRLYGVLLTLVLAVVWIAIHT